jgi:hypothetical protein
MTEPPQTSARALAEHVDAWQATNDADAPQPPADIGATPLRRLSAALPQDRRLRDAARIVTVCGLVLVFDTRAPSHCIWQALAGLDSLLSDSRRLSPRFATLAMNGGLDPAEGDVYRLEDRRPARLRAIGRALAELSPETPAPALRRSDIVLARCGPFGGETGEIVADAAANHPRAGRAALWVLAHGEGAGPGLRVRLEAAEIARWAWAPDCLAARDGQDPELDDGIVDWPWLFERMLAATDGRPVPCEETIRIEGPWRTLSEGEAVREILRLHPALAACTEALDADS